MGSALIRSLEAAGYKNLATRMHAELELSDQRAVREFFQTQAPEYVFLAAAKAGGIFANDTYPAEFIRENLAIQTNVIHEAWRADVKHLLFLGSSCIYPRDCPQPMKEEYLLTGPLEPTNHAYSVAKIAGIEMCWSYNRQYGTQFLAVMPTNLYGLGDNYDLETSHVIPALICKMHEAKLRGNNDVVIWGTGTPRREFLYSDDLADSCVFLMNLVANEFESLVAGQESPPLINIGCGHDLTIRELVGIVKEVVGYEGQFQWDRGKPDGTPQKLLDVSRLNRLGWEAKISIKDGLRLTYQDFLTMYSTKRS